MENWGIHSLDFPQSSPQGILDDKKKAGLKALNLPYGFLWPGWPEPRPKENHRENGGSAAQIFPKALHKRFWRTEKVPFFFPHGIWGELWGNLGSEPPLCLWIPLAWVVWAQNLLGVLLPPRPPENLATLPLGIFRVFGGTKIPKIHWMEAATQSTQAKGKHRETGVFSAHFTQSSPQ